MSLEQKLKPLEKKDIIRCYKGLKFGRFTPFIRKVYYLLQRIIGNYSIEDQIKISSLFEPPLFYFNYGIMVSHPYGITFSIDECGCDVCIGQNVTIGTNGKNMYIGEGTKGHKPRLGNLIRVYPQTIISGEIRIGDFVLIAGGAVVTKDIPSRSIVYNVNEIKPLRRHHYKALQQVLYHCYISYVKMPGLMYKDEKLYINESWISFRAQLINSLDNLDEFIRLISIYSMG